jgi:hypothetical protein
MATELDAVQLPLDVDGHLRRECPSCHRQFLVRFSEQEPLGIQRELARHLPHHNDAELEPPAHQAHCPYCGAAAAPESWFTAEQRAYLEKRAEHWRRQLRHVQLGLPRLALSANPNLTFLPIEPEPFETPLPNEPGGLCAFPLLCCGEQVKLLEGWRSPVHCYHCGARHDPPRVRPGALQRLEEG